MWKNECKKFKPNIFNKNKCANCYRDRGQHSDEALEVNKATRIVSKCGYLVLKLLLIKQIKQLHRQLGTQIIDLVLLEILSNYRRLSSAPHSGPHYRK